MTVEELLGTTAKRTGKRGAGAGAATAARTNSGIAGSQAARHRAGARLSAGQPVTNHLTINNKACSDAGLVRLGRSGCEADDH